MEKIMMYCYAGESWDSTPIRDRAIQDVTTWSPEKVAILADIQQEMLGRQIHIKRGVKNE